MLKLSIICFFNFFGAFILNVFTLNWLKVSLRAYSSCLIKHYILTLFFFTIWDHMLIIFGF